MPHLEAPHCKKMWHTFDTQSFLECVISGLRVIILMYPHDISLSDICSSSCSTESMDHPCLGIIHVACKCKALENMHGIAHILKVKYRFFKTWYIFENFTLSEIIPETSTSADVVGDW